MSKQKIECDNCGEVMYRIPSNVNNGNNFCSRECANEFGYKTITCDNCGQKIKRKKSDIRDTHNFCSQECWQEFQRTGKKTVKCSQCGKEIKRWPFQIKKHDNFFCSKKCEGKWLSENQTGEDHHNYKEKVTVNCAICGKEKKVYPYRLNRVNRFFCSRECQDEWQSENIKASNHPNWKGGSVRPRYYGPNFSKQRKKVLERDNHQCQACGKGKDETELHCHHIIPYKEFRYPIFEGNPIKNPLAEFDWKRANRLDNLITLCKSCHPKVENSENCQESINKIKQNQHK